MAGYGVKQAVQDARIAKGHRQEESSCGQCGTPVHQNETLCRDCKTDVVVVSPNGSYVSYLMPS